MHENFMIGKVNIAAVANCERDGGTKLTEAVRPISDLEDARAYLSHMDFTLLREKLCLKPEQGGQGWTPDVALHAEVKYKKWLFLKRKYDNAVIPPPVDIDTVWHSHILDTQAYMRDTAAVFGQYLHHYPYFGLRGKADHDKLTEAFEYTKRLYKEEYAEDITA